MRKASIFPRRCLLPRQNASWFEGSAIPRDGLRPTGTDLLMVQLAPWVGRLNLLLGVVILVLAAALTRSH